MGSAAFCCIDSRQKTKSNEEVVDTDEETVKEQENKGWKKLKSAGKTNGQKKGKKQNRQFVNLREQTFKNQLSSFSVYNQEEAKQFNRIDCRNKNKGYLLVYQSIKNQDLQINFTQQIFMKNDKDNIVPLKQIKYLQKLDHPFIPSFVECFETETEYKIIMTEIPSLTLEDLILKHRKFTEVQIRLLSQQLFLMARYFHKSNLVFLGFSPENIFIYDALNFKSLKLARFTEVTQQSKNKTAFLDTDLYNEDYYLSYEMKDRSQSLNSSTDVFAIGVIMLQMIIGEHPKKFVSNWSQRLEQDQYGGSTVLMNCLNQHKIFMSQALYDVISECFQIFSNKRKQPQEILKLKFFQIQEPLQRQYREFFYKIKLFEQLNK